MSEIVFWALLTYLHLTNPNKKLVKKVIGYSRLSKVQGYFWSDNTNQLNVQCSYLIGGCFQKLIAALACVISFLRVPVLIIRLPAQGHRRVYDDSWLVLRQHIVKWRQNKCFFLLLYFLVSATLKGWGLQSGDIKAILCIGCADITLVRWPYRHTSGPGLLNDIVTPQDQDYCMISSQSNDIANILLYIVICCDKW